MRTGTFRASDVDARWEEVVWRFLQHDPGPEPTFDITVRVSTPDPFYEKPPRGLRNILRWVSAGARFRWWDPPVTELTFYGVKKRDVGGGRGGWAQ